MGWLFTSKKDRLIQEANEFLTALKQNGGLKPVAADLMMKPNEKAYLQESRIVLKETRAVRKSSGSAAGFRIAKGVYIGKTRGTSHSEQVLQDIDRGTLVLTNQRLVFDGATENRVIKLDKVLSVQMYRDAIEVSLDGRAKSIFFTVNNPYIWSTVFRIIQGVPDPENLKDVNLKISFE